MNAAVCAVWRLLRLTGIFTWSRSNEAHGASSEIGAPDDAEREMRSAFVIDARGTIRAVATPSFAAGFVHVILSGAGAEVAFHRHSVPLPAFANALCLLSSSRSKRIALRLLPDSSEPVRILSGVWQFADHAERLALPRVFPEPENVPTHAGASTLLPRLSHL